MTAEGYTRVQIRLHWAVVLLVAAQFVLRDGIVASFKTKVATGVVNFTGLTVAHFAIGLLIFLLAVWRILLRRSLGAPLPPEGDPDWQKLLVRLTHAGIYGCLRAMPITGFIAWAGPVPLFGGIHGALRLLLLALVLLHIAGALYGQFVQRTGILRRMMKPVD